MPERTVNELLCDRFKATKSIDALVGHFQAAVDEYHRGQWEKSLAKAGKFLEAVLKALLTEAGLPAQTGRAFKVDKAINDLQGVPAGIADDTVRLTIPRCCRFIYDVTSNRGARHDADEVNPNEMDATAVLGDCAWVVAEMVRYSQKSLDLLEAKRVVDGLMKRRYPFVEEIGGRLYVDLPLVLSARDTGLLILWARGTRRVSRSELVAAIGRQSRRISRANARKAVQRLYDVVDEDGSGDLRLRASGFREAEQLIDRAKAQPS